MAAHSAIQAWMICLVASVLRSGEMMRLEALAAHEVKDTVADADPAHAVVDAARAESLLGDHESVALRP